MDVPQEGKTRKRRGAGGRRRKSRVAAAEQDTTVVTKDPAVVTAATTTKPVPAPVAAAKPIVAPKVVLAPPKPKTPKVVLVPKGKTVQTHTRPVRKTFKAKQLNVTIDNSAKTQKRRSSMMTKVDEMTDDQIRAAAVHARLSRRETVAKAPIGLLRQMVKDYQIMKGRLL
jgi:hypothetical protein